MATPKNPLDEFVTYIPHYELHLSDNWSDLAKIKDKDANNSTTPKGSNETLLINTRKDAHQQIDNIKFMYWTPTVDPSGSVMPVGNLTLDVIEPNGTSFVEKLTERMRSLKITNYGAGAQFGLKIFFVGRTADGTEKTIPFRNIIPLNLTLFDANYSERGGVYHLQMVVTSSALGSTPLIPKNSIARSTGFINKNISFKAGTVQEAIPLLEEQLNKNYRDTYATLLLNSTGAKDLKYHIELSPKITGSINLVTKDSLAKGEKCQLTFTPEVDIGTMIRQILMSSKEVCEMVGKSIDGLEKEGHPDVKFPVLQTFYHLDKEVINLIYRINLYEGGDTSDTFEFDYYFSGKNVDVLEFEVKFNNMQNWLASSINSVELNRNADGKIPAFKPNFWSSNCVPEDRTCQKLYYSPTERKSISAQQGDPANLPATNRLEGTGFAKYEVETVPSARLAFETYGRIVGGSTHPQVTFTIRGHLNILDRLVYPPDGTYNTSTQSGTQSLPSHSAPSGVHNSTWIKVNIFDKDGHKFFYTGRYQLMSVENIFQGGKFLQNLFVLMLDDTSKPVPADFNNTRQVK